MSPELRASRACPPWLAVLAAAVVAGGCAVPASAPPPAPVGAQLPPAIRLLEPVARPAPPKPPSAVTAPVQGALPGGIRTDSNAAMVALLGYGERLRRMQAAEIATEVQRLSDKPEAERQPADDMQLAMALSHTQAPADVVRAQAVLQRVLASNREDARGLHPLAGLLAMRLAEQRRAEELAERQAQQLREQQRRIDQLNERLEAVRAVERSLAPRSGPAVNGVPARPLGQ